MAERRVCPECGTEVAPALLACPSCGRLVHGERLKQLAAEAGAAEANGDPTAALAAWREVSDLLPPESRQHQTAADHMARLSDIVDRAPAPTITASSGRAGAGMAKLLGPLGMLGLLLWKAKTLVALLLTKGKFLLLGLSKAGTAFSMLLSFGLYWTAFGWKFALGLVLSIYVHEMGHVAALRRFGIAATAPMFIPGLGAMVRLKQHPASPLEEARVGLAGPIWGLGAAIAAYLVFLATDAPIWGAIARVGAWINLFNLLPVWQLDGSRGFAALTRGQRFAVAATFAGCWVATHEGLLILLAIAAAVRAYPPTAPAIGDRTTLVQFVALVIALSAMCLIQPGI